MKRVTLVKDGSDPFDLEIFFVRRVPTKTKKKSENFTRDAILWADGVIDSMNMPKGSQVTLWWARLLCAAAVFFNLGLIIGILI